MRVVAPMTGGPLRCVDRGAVWHSVPAARVAATHGGCLTCGGELELVKNEDGDEGEEGETG